MGGRLNQFLGTLGQTERNWCCDRCRTAARAAKHAPGDKHAANHSWQHRGDEVPHAGPEAIERRG